MHAEKWEMAQIMVEQDALRPTAFLMTPLALLTLLSLMHVVADVAAVAFFAQFFLVEFTAMARGAAQLFMFAFERPIGVGRVVKALMIPAFFAVAGITILTVTASVLVIIAVTAVALFAWFFLGYRFLVASGAANRLVFAF